MGSVAAPKMTPQQLNGLQRQAVLSNSVNMMQLIYSQFLTPSQTPVITINPRPVGLIKRFLVKFTATVTNSDADNAINLTDLGLANFFSNITFTDLNNNQRINTAGWHVSFLNSVRHRKPFGGGWTVQTDEMSKYGENYPVIQAPASFAKAGDGDSGTISGYYDIPIAYSDDDLRGSIYANIINAVMQLTLTFNPTPFSATGSDSTFAVYSGSASAALSNVQISVYQEYLDQLPIGQGGVVLPSLDVSTIYEMKTSQFQNIPTGQDFPIQYANFRDFLSTMAIFNHDGSGDSGRTVGSDINYWELQAANFTNFWQLDPVTQSLMTRQIISTDLPPGCYYFSSRKRPISTVQYGNTEIVINAHTSTNNSYLQVGWEDLALINTLTQAGSLASGG